MSFEKPEDFIHKFLVGSALGPDEHGSLVAWPVERQKE
jgi:hypothetical protein